MTVQHDQAIIIIIDYSVHRDYVVYKNGICHTEERVRIKVEAKDPSPVPVGELPWPSDLVMSGFRVTVTLTGVGT